MKLYCFFYVLFFTVLMAGRACPAERTNTSLSAWAAGDYKPGTFYVCTNASGRFIKDDIIYPLKAISPLKIQVLRYRRGAESRPGVVKLQTIMENDFEYFVNTPESQLDSQVAARLKEESGSYLQSQTQSSPFFVIKSLLVLVLIIAGGWLVLRIIKKRQTPAVDSDLFQDVATFPLGVGAVLKIVRLNNAYLVLGVSSNSVNLVCEVEDKETIDALNLEAHRKQKSSTMFGDLIAKYLKGFPQKKPIDITKSLKNRIDGM